VIENARFRDCRISLSRKNKGEERFWSFPEDANFLKSQETAPQKISACPFSPFSRNMRKVRSLVTRAKSKWVSTILDIIDMSADLIFILYVLKLVTLTFIKFENITARFLLACFFNLKIRFFNLWINVLTNNSN